MPYRYKIIVYLVGIIIACIILWLITGVIFADNPQNSPEGSLNATGNDLITITDNSLVGISSPYLLPLKTYGSLIDDLIQCESNGNPLAVGDNGRAKGILQFHEPTFKQYCVNKYGYSNDIWSEEIQINCANEMLEDNFNNVLHWTCYKLI